MLAGYSPTWPSSKNDPHACPRPSWKRSEAAAVGKGVDDVGHNRAGDVDWVDQKDRGEAG